MLKFSQYNKSLIGFALPILIEALQSAQATGDPVAALSDPSTWVQAVVVALGVYAIPNMKNGKNPMKVNDFIKGMKR